VEIEETVAGLDKLSSPCRLCSRRCGVDRGGGEMGWCRTGNRPLVAEICLHRGEEPAISGPRGICNVFFAHCTLQCLYCQNNRISSNRVEHPGWIGSLDELTEAVCSVLDQGASGLGLVSPTHQLPAAARLIRDLRRRGRRPVVVYNTSGYERVEVLRELEDLVDVYLPDLKYLDPEIAGAWSGAPDYPAAAADALREMYRQKGSLLRFDQDGVAVSGMIVRHLVLPGAVENTRDCLRFIAGELSPRLHVSLMAQYHPIPAVAGVPGLDRRLRRSEYDSAVEELGRLGLDRGWTQELESHGYYLPDFEGPQVFPDT